MATTNTRVCDRTECGVGWANYQSAIALSGVGWANHQPLTNRSPIMSICPPYY
ncbi:MAG: hypothetical protein F6K65_39560 [Moorea sp. SIO3C2]|nr:hypothetical protein [Moorena sp. SIO3C2]